MTSAGICSHACPVPFHLTSHLSLCSGTGSNGVGQYGTRSCGTSKTTVTLNWHSRRLQPWNTTSQRTSHSGSDNHQPADRQQQQPRRNNNTPDRSVSRPPWQPGRCLPSRPQLQQAALRIRMQLSDAQPAKHTSSVPSRSAGLPGVEPLNNGQIHHHSV